MQAKLQPRVADFLIIGAMKAGTTTLFRDLETHPDVFFPVDKEPNTLCDPEVVTPAGRSEYARLFRRARAGQLCGDASTAYAKRPTFEQVAERAAEILSPSAKIVMIVREPVSRIVSQHRHELYSQDIAEESIDEAVKLHPHLIEYSKYAMQLEPWLTSFGHERVRIVLFEDYIANRAAEAAQVQGFLGLQPRPELIDVEAKFNAREESRIATGFWRRVIQGELYRTVLRPLLSERAKQAAQRILLPAPPPRPNAPSAATVRLVLDEVREDSDHLAEIMGFPRPLWNEADIYQQFTERRAVDGGVG